MSKFINELTEKKIVKCSVLDKDERKESIITMLASEDVLKKEWSNKEDDRWNDTSTNISKKNK